ncbi:MAG: thiosulfate oxidation carrier complex protein SoxZ [Gammaproteobacteria bacterium]|nr:thiosulfate oxidation carrier complex protein SoxZ [Gammaproteobacteria bacterium]
MSDTIKLRATLEGDVTTVKALILHVMETGLFKDRKTGAPIPAHFVQEITCTHNGAVVLSADWGIAVSKNPYIAFNFKGGKKGDTIALSWVDNLGGRDALETTIS